MVHPEWLTLTLIFCALSMIWIHNVLHSPPPVLSDNNTHLSSSYTDVCTKICSSSGSIMLPAWWVGCGRVFFFRVFNKSDCHMQVFTVASHSWGNKLSITIILSCSSNKKLWLHFTIQTSAGIYLVPPNHSVSLSACRIIINLILSVYKPTLFTLN